MQVPNPESNAPGKASHVLNAAEFRRRFRWLIFHTWNIPPVFGLGFILLIGVLTPAQIFGILITPLEPAYILGWLAFALWFLPRSMRPLADWLDSKPGSSPEQAVRAARRFPLIFWTTFLIYLVIAPASVIVAAELYTGFVATPYDWFRIELVALIVSIIVGLPIFFLIFDLFGLALGGLELRRPIITVKIKVFLIGALVPLLIDTMLVQYYWTRTGYFTFETFGVWVLLELLAIGGSLIFAHSFGQSLGPLQQLIGAPRPLPDEHVAALRPRSTDELGLLTKDYRLLLDELRLHGEILELSNRLLRSAGSEADTAAVFNTVVDLCRQAIGADQAFLIVHDPVTNTLVGVAQTDAGYRPEGHYRLTLEDQSLAVWSFTHRQTVAVEDALSDPRVSPQLCARFGIRSAMATPLKLGDEMLGVLMVAHTANHRAYDDRDCLLIEGLAREAALALQTQRLRQAREQAEAERLEQAEQVRTLLDATEEGIYGADSNGLCTFINRAALRMLGYRQPEELLGRNLHELIHHTLPDGRPYPKEQCRVRLAMLAGDTAHADNEVHWRADGTSFPVEYWSHPIVREGRTVGTVVSFIDISERKQVENTLRESETRLRNVLAVTGEGIWDWDLATDVVRHNKRWCELLGLSEKFLQHPVAEFAACLHDDDRAAVTARIEACLKGNGPYHSEHRMRRSDGRIIWVQDRGDVVERDAQGRALRMVGSFADITERRGAEEALHSTTERFHQAMRAARAGAWEWNIVTNKATWSEENFTVLGLQPNTHQASFETWLNCVHPEDRERCTHEIKEALDAGSDLNLEFRVVWPNGEVRWINDVGRLVYDETGKPASMHGIQIDITERKQAEVLREAGVMQQRAIINASPVPQALNDEHQNITFLNPAFTQTFGYTREDIPTLADWWPKAYPDPEYRKWVAETWQATLDKAQREGTAFLPLDLNVRCKDGTVKTVLASAAPIGKSFAGSHLVVLYDITERRQAEQSLRASEERLRTILDTEPECVKILESDGTLLEMNPAGLAMIEADTLAQVQGQKLSNIVTDEHRAAFVDMVRRVIENGESGQLELEIVGLKGTRRWLETYAVPMRDEASGGTWLLGVTRDITDRKRAEEAIRTLNAELEQRVKHRTAELETANRELEAFSYSVSHDLRAPLRAIDGFSRILSEDFASHLNAEGQGHLDRVRNAVQRMGVLIDELLELSRVGRGAMRVSTVDLSHLADEVVAQLRHGEPARTVEVDIAPGITGQGDVRLLRLVLENLLGNAWKYTAKTAAARIAFTASKQDGQRVYRITDNGAGFDMQYADKLFRPFQRLHTTQEFPGSGVGLATVARIIHRHGGRVWAEAEVGKGAAFFFTLRQPGARD